MLPDHMAVGSLENQKVLLIDSARNNQRSERQADATVSLLHDASTELQEHGRCWR